MFSVLLVSIIEKEFWAIPSSASRCQMKASLRVDNCLSCKKAACQSIWHKMGTGMPRTDSCPMSMLNFKSCQLLTLMIISRKSCCIAKLIWDLLWLHSSHASLHAETEGKSLILISLFGFTFIELLWAVAAWGISDHQVTTEAITMSRIIRLIGHFICEHCSQMGFDTMRLAFKWYLHRNMSHLLYSLQRHLAWMQS